MLPWEAFKTNKQWEQYLKHLVRTNDTALLRAVVVVYDNQTDEEKREGICIGDNNVGFSKYDVKQLSEIAEKIKHKIPLSKPEVVLARSKMPKYWKQLMVASKRRMEEKAKLVEEIQMELNMDQPTASSPYQCALAKCSEESVACDYGICDECPNGKQKYKVNRSDKQWQ